MPKLSLQKKFSDTGEGHLCLIDKAVEGGREKIEFEHKSVDYVRFQTNTLGKGINSLIPIWYGLNKVITILH